MEMLFLCYLEQFVVVYGANAARAMTSTGQGLARSQWLVVSSPVATERKRLCFVAVAIPSSYIACDDCWRLFSRFLAKNVPQL